MIDDCDGKLCSSHHPHSHYYLTCRSQHFYTLTQIYSRGLNLLFSNLIPCIYLLPLIFLKILGLTPKMCGKTSYSWRFGLKFSSLTVYKIMVGAFSTASAGKVFKSPTKEAQVTLTGRQRGGRGVPGKFLMMFHLFSTILNHSHPIQTIQPFCF